jgi:hypothetical protein
MLGEELNHHRHRVWWLKAIKILTIRLRKGLGDMTFSLVVALLKILFSWDLFHLSKKFKRKRKKPLFPWPTNCRHSNVAYQIVLHKYYQCILSSMKGAHFRFRSPPAHICSQSRSWMSRSTASNKLTSQIGLISVSPAPMMILEISMHKSISDVISFCQKCTLPVLHTRLLHETYLQYPINRQSEDSRRH